MCISVHKRHIVQVPKYFFFSCLFSRMKQLRRHFNRNEIAGKTFSRRQSLAIGLPDLLRFLTGAPLQGDAQPLSKSRHIVTCANSTLIRRIYWLRIFLHRHQVRLSHNNKYDSCIYMRYGYQKYLDLILLHSISYFACDVIVSCSERDIKLKFQSNSLYSTSNILKKGMDPPILTPAIVKQNNQSKRNDILNQKLYVALVQYYAAIDMIMRVKMTL